MPKSRQPRRQSKKCCDTSCSCRHGNVTDDRTFCPCHNDNEMYRLLFEKSPEGVFIMASEGKDAGKIIDVNESAAQMHGYSVEELKAMKITDLDVPENIMKAPKRFEKIIEGEWIGGEVLHRRKDGSLFPVEFRAGPLKTGGKTFTLAFTRDISHHVTAEKQAEQSKVFVDSIVNNIADPVFVKDGQHRWIFMNDAMCSFMGHAREELIGKSDYEFFPKEQADVFWEKDELVFAQGKQNVNEEQFTDAKGVVHTIITKKSIFTDAGGKKTLVGVIRDVTNRKRAEQDSRRLAAIVECTDDAIYTKSIDGIILTWNNGAEKLYGYTAGDIIGRNVSVLTTPEFRDEIDAILQKAGQGERVSQLETVRRKKDGSLCNVSLTVSPVHDAAGHVSVISVIARNITKLKRTEENERKTAEKMRDLYDNAPCGYHSLDPEGRIVNINKTELLWLGYDRKDIIGKNITEFLTQKSVGVFREKFPTFKERGFIKDLELEFVRSNGSILPVLINATAIVNNAGQLLMTRTTMYDITDIRKAETAMLKLKNEQRIILDSVRAWIFYKDKDNRFIQVNKAFCEAMGMTKEQLEGTSLFDLFPKEQAEAYWQDDKPVMSSGKATLGIIESLQTPTGTRWVQTDKIPFFDEKGSIIGVIGFAMDITELHETRKKLEEEAENAKKFMEAVEASSVATVITTPEPAIIYANPAWEQLTGYPEEEGRGKNPRILQSGKTPHELYGRMWETILQGREFGTDEIVNKRKNGTEFNAELHVFPIMENGKAKYFVGLQTDITLRKRTDLAKSEFMSLASHQLRTPLTGIRWGLSLLTRREPLTLNQQALVTEIQGQTARMAESINVMLHLSRIEASRMEVKRSSCSLATIVKELCNEFHPLAEQKKQQCRFRLDDNITMTTDPALLKEILSNLISNAIKYTPEGKTIELTSKILGDDVRIAIRDEGYGIPQYQQDKVFSKFFRATNVVDKIPDGTGLGLYLVYALTKLLGGRVTFVSEENEGSTFSLTIPLHPPTL